MSSFFSPKLLLLFTALILTNACVAQFSVSSLKTNYQETPLGIDVTTPVFSWQMATKNNLRAQYQTAYQINVSDVKPDRGAQDKVISKNDYTFIITVSK